MSRRTRGYRLPRTLVQLANSTALARSLKDATKSLHVHFLGPKTPASLPTESRRMLQAFIDDHTGKIEHDEAARASQELRQFWQKYVAGNAQKLGAFVGVLRELRPAIESEEDALAWYRDVARPVITGTAYKKNAVDDAQEFIAQLMIYDEEQEDSRQSTSDHICRDLLAVYLERTGSVREGDVFVAEDNVQVAQQVENCLSQFGRKMAKQLFHHLDDLVVRAETRLQGLTLLSSFLRHQAPHLYTVIHTPLVDSLLKCLMNDTSTTILSVALTSLIMLLPHIPGSLTARLPRLFLIYSRLLCWERFSALSSLSQKNLVTDDRYPANDERDNGDVGLDSSWEKARPQDGVIEAATPELMTYYTYLYGLYPLNFMDYIRKPRRYLKLANFPSADEFDLDRSIIRSRSDQFRQAHLLHPNFLNMTIDDEKIDPKWPKMDPADVVADCHSLCVNGRASMLSPGPPPTGRLPPLPLIPPNHNGSLSPTISHASLRSGTGSSWREDNSARVSGTTADPESPILPPEDDGDHLRPRSKGGRGSSLSDLRDDFPMPAAGLGSIKSTRDVPEQPQTNVAYLQREVTLLRNDLNFERWHKSQYSQHIAQLMRKAVKDATVEAETLNLLNANRALKQQLDQVRSAREATIKDANLTRKQANNLEHNLTERFQKMKREQEVWAADMEELRRLRVETKHYRDLLSASEARELNKSHQLELMERNMESMTDLQKQLKEARQKIREFEYREFEMMQAQKEAEFLQSENGALQGKLDRLEHDREQSDPHVESAGQRGLRPESGSYQRSLAASPISAESSPAVLAMSQALADAQSKFATLKKLHSRLMEKHADLELEMATIQGHAPDSRRNSMLSGGDYGSMMSGAIPGRPGVLESIYAVTEYDQSEVAHTTASASDPTDRRYQDVASPDLKPKSEPSMISSIHRVSKPSAGSIARSQGSLVYNKTAPLRPDERSLTGGSETSSMKAAKIRPDSEVRVFGRGKLLMSCAASMHRSLIPFPGGAQNIKLKPVKEKDKASLKDKDKSEPRKGLTSRALKGMGF